MEDDLVLVPITTFQAGLARQTTAGGELSLQVITVQVADRQLVEQAKEEVRAILLDRHGSSEEEDFSIISQEDVLQIVGQVTGIFTLFLGAIAGISLLVGGIGIMNIMLVSVTERTREIGIRKAVGAKRRHIMLQFLLEATFLSLAGGIVGILLGMGLSGLVSGIRMGEVALQPAVTLPVVLLAFSLSAAIGIFFGFYPASRAARLDPIQALRYE
jgi:putative ABC transport system permease protein